MENNKMLTLTLLGLLLPSVHGADILSASGAYHIKTKCHPDEVRKNCHSIKLRNVTVMMKSGVVEEFKELIYLNIAKTDSSRDGIETKKCVRKYAKAIDIYFREHGNLIDDNGLYQNDLPEVKPIMSLPYKVNFPFKNVEVYNDMDGLILGDRDYAVIRTGKQNPFILVSRSGNKKYRRTCESYSRGSYFNMKDTSEDLTPEFIESLDPRDRGNLVSIGDTTLRVNDRPRVWENASHKLNLLRRKAGDFFRSTEF